MTHRLKTWPRFYRAIKSGKKLFEIRRDDRAFEVGDDLLLCEYKPKRDEFTGRQIKVRVTCILRKHDGLKRGFALMGITRVDVTK